MKQVFIMGITTLVAITLVCNVYAQVDEQTETMTSLAATEAEKYLKASGDVISACTFLAQMDMLTPKCVNFVIDYRDSLKGLVDRHYSSPDNGSSIEKLPNLN